MKMHKYKNYVGINTVKTSTTCTMSKSTTAIAAAVNN
jgi:hypothetical protein